MDNLRERFINTQTTNIIPQLLVEITVCMGAFSFGNVIGWGCPALHHLKEFKYGEIHAEYYYNWALSLGPLGAAVGIIPWYGVMGYLGPKAVMLCQAPFLLLCWFLIGYYDTYITYCTAHFFSAFLAVSYIYAGEAFLTETVYKTYLKDMYIYFRCSVILGILFMNCIGSLLSKWTLSLICAFFPTICSTILIFLPDSPVYLMQQQDIAAEKALKFYRGKNASINMELRVMRQYMIFINYGFNSNQILSAKVVQKAISIVIMLHVIKIMTGYYTFLLDGARIFTKGTSIISSYVDNVIFSAMALVLCIIGLHIHIRMLLGVKKPMMVSMLLMAAILFLIGSVCLIDKELSINNQKCMMLSTLCLYVAAYESGMNLGPDIILFHYLPYQVYHYLMMLMIVLDWSLVFVTLWVFMLTHSLVYLAIMFWVYGAVAVCGMVYVLVRVLEPRGKTLLMIQLALGGNPIGMRGSRRRRIPHPLEDFELENYAQQLMSQALALL